MLCWTQERLECLKGKQGSLGRGTPLRAGLEVYPVLVFQAVSYNGEGSWACGPKHISVAVDLSKDTDIADL